MEANAAKKVSVIVCTFDIELPPSSRLYIGDRLLHERRQAYSGILISRDGSFTTSSMWQNLQAKDETVEAR